LSDNYSWTVANSIFDAPYKYDYFARPLQQYRAFNHARFRLPNYDHAYEESRRLPDGSTPETRWA
jgi:hypothetical protein